MTTQQKVERMAIINPYGEYAIPVSKVPLLIEAMSHMIRIEQDYTTKKWKQPETSGLFIKYLNAQEAAALLFDTGIMSVVDVDVDVEAK